jgi:glycosyltransferase involved in cell wall biosynthesis
MPKPLVTILIPNYKTLELTKLCLRLIRKHTDPLLAKVLVIDNDSQDESTEYLRSLSWIELIERPKVLNEPPVMAHARALDLGLSQVTTPFVLSIHTDTLMKHPKWLPFLLAQIAKSPTIGGVGSWKLEAKPWIKRLLKHCERFVQTRFAKLRGRVKPIGEEYHYLRSHCALYRMDLIRKYSLSFADGEQVAGKLMHKKLVELGHQMVFLPSETLGLYLDHVNHATTLLNSEFKDSIRRDRNKELKSLKIRLENLGSAEVLANPKLDF